MVTSSANFEQCAKATIDMFNDFKDWINVKLDIINFCSKNQRVIDNTEILNEAFQLGTQIINKYYKKSEE